MLPISLFPRCVFFPTLNIIQTIMEEMFQIVLSFLLHPPTCEVKAQLKKTCKCTTFRIFKMDIIKWKVLGDLYIKFFFVKVNLILLNSCNRTVSTIEIIQVSFAYFSELRKRTRWKLLFEFTFAKFLIFVGRLANSCWGLRYWCWWTPPPAARAQRWTDSLQTGLTQWYIYFQIIMFSPPPSQKDYVFFHAAGYPAYFIFGIRLDSGYPISFGWSNNEYLDKLVSGTTRFLNKLNVMHIASSYCIKKQLNILFHNHVQQFWRVYYLILIKISSKYSFCSHCIMFQIHNSLYVFSKIKIQIPTLSPRTFLSAKLMNIWCNCSSFRFVSLKTCINHF